MALPAWTMHCFAAWPGAACCFRSLQQPALLLLAAQAIIDSHYPLVARALVEARQEVLVRGDFCCTCIPGHRTARTEPGLGA